MSPVSRRQTVILALCAILLVVILFIGEAWMVPMLLGLTIGTMGLNLTALTRVRQQYTDRGVAELNGDPKHTEQLAEEDYTVTWQGALDLMRPEVRALFITTPDRVPLVTANNRLTEKEARAILARHGRPYDGPIQFTDDHQTVYGVLGTDPFDPLTTPSEAPDVGHGIDCACYACWQGRRYYDRQHRPIDATTYYR